MPHAGVVAEYKPPKPTRTPATVSFRADKGDDTIDAVFNKLKFGKSGTVSITGKVTEMARDQYSYRATLEVEKVSADNPGTMVDDVKKLRKAHRREEYE